MGLLFFFALLAYPLTTIEAYQSDQNWQLLLEHHLENESMFKYGELGTNQPGKFSFLLGVKIP